MHKQRRRARWRYDNVHTYCPCSKYRIQIGVGWWAPMQPAKVTACTEQSQETSPAKNYNHPFRMQYYLHDCNSSRIETVSNRSHIQIVNLISKLNLSYNNSKCTSDFLWLWEKSLISCDFDFHVNSHVNLTHCKSFVELKIIKFYVHVLREQKKFV